ncbi:MAG: hypothetical protein CO094_00680 [Anaerolineae bacterium CG_4_9_14_3_um_filter_57_17]|nr:MAG: hypothetical protein CO094_00680 [Anaerolineae bacterium CG_4_9_14_3_um_filter_57_17]
MYIRNILSAKQHTPDLESEKRGKMTEAEKDSNDFVVLKPQEVAQRLRCSAALVYKLSQLGQLPSVRIGRKVTILESDLIKFVEINRYPQPGPLTHDRR